MCEHYVARAAEPFALSELWPFTEKLERFGIAGFGWGVSWLSTDRHLEGYRDLRAFREDPGRDRVGDVRTTSALVHLRRPSKLSTLTLPDTQPFDDPAVWGILALDVMKHAARAYQQLDGRSQEEAYKRILAGFTAEMQHPTEPR